MEKKINILSNSLEIKSQTSVPNNKKSYADLVKKVSQKSPFGKKSIFYTPPLENFSNDDDISGGLKKI